MWVAMWVKSIKQLKRREVARVAAAVVVFGGSTWAIGHWLAPSSRPRPAMPQTAANLGAAPESVEESQAQASQVVHQTLVPGTVPEATKSEKDSDRIAATAQNAQNAQNKASAPPSVALKLKSGIGIQREGRLRISNPTEYPVRVALLPQAPLPAGAAPYEPPAHWDFDPAEGYTTGLLVGLPNQTRLQVKSGDVLVAFALDGSRRYWGPYVVGSTEIPNWEPKGGEWRLILQP
jgi:hypothetical protein